MPDEGRADIGATWIVESLKIAAAPEIAVPREKESDLSSTESRRSATDSAALILRLTLGPMMAVHGLNKVFGPDGLEGTTRYFEFLGLRPANVHARVAATTEIGTGVLLTLGAATPLASAGVIGIMAVASATDHKGKGFFVFRGGWEYVGVVGATAAALSALGPGRFSVDGVRGKARGGLRSALFSTALGVASAVGMLVVSRKPASPDGEVEADPEPVEDPAAGA